MLDRMFLFILKRRLKTYKKDAKWYEKTGNYNNWYHERGIPELQRQILEMETIIKMKKGV